MTSPSMSAPSGKAGVRVLELGVAGGGIAAAYAGWLLREMGADVTRLGSPQPAADTITTPEELALEALCEGKACVALPEQPGAIEALIEGCDILLCDAPEELERLLGPIAALRARYPRLIAGVVTTFGLDGPYAGYPGTGLDAQALSGVAWALVGYPSEDPIGALNFAASDPNASIHALVPLFAALRRAAATGAGCYIDFSQIEALLNTLRPYLLDSQVQHRQPPTRGNSHPGRAPHGIYPSLEEDSWLSLSIADDSQWRALARLIPEQAWAREECFRTTHGRVTHRDEIDRAIATWSATLPRDVLSTMLREAGIAATPVLSVEEQWRDRHYAARNVREIVDIPFYGAEALVKAPWRFSDCEPRITRSGPTTGEHNDCVFGELLGLSSQAISELEATGVIG